jgi:acyl carrier protein
MSSPNYFQELLKIISPYLPEDIQSSSVQSNSHLINDLNINSSHMVDIVLDVEDLYDIRLEDTDMQEMQTVSDAMRIIQEKVAGS